MAVPGTNSRGALPFSKHPVLFVLLLVLTPALWVAFVSTTNPHELFVGFFASAATIVFTVFVCRSSSTRLQLRPPDLIQLWRIPWYLLQDSIVVLRVLAKDLLHIQPAGDHYRVCGFDASTHDPVRVARMVLAVASTTATPNSIVLGIDPSQSRMLFHQVERTPVTEMAKALGAKA